MENTNDCTISSLVDYTEAPVRVGVSAPTGLPKLDDAIGGGMHPGELALMASVQGAGMSALMLNMAYKAALSGQYNLFISLEMPAQPVQARILSVAANIRAQRFRECGSVIDMTLDEQRRLERVRGSDLYARLGLMDYSAHACTVDNLADAVSRWLDGLTRLGVRDRAGYVYIDKLEFIQVADLPPNRTNLDPGIVDSTVGRIKRDIAADLGVRVCLSTHAHHQAEGVEAMEAEHLKYSRGLYDTADFCIGLTSGRYAHGTSEDLTVHGDIPAGVYRKVVSLFKARIGHATSFSLYQGPSLGLYDTMVACRESIDMLPATID